MKRLFKFRYPKIALWIIFIIAAYFIFSNPAVKDWINGAGPSNYLYVFLFGALFTFGFTTPFSIGFFVDYSPQNLLVSVLIGGLGALLFDLAIFKFIRFSFMDEFNRLKNGKKISRLSNLFQSSLPHKMKIYLTYVFAGIVIASPLPDELGIAMLSGLTKIRTIPLMILSFVFNSLGILIMMLI
jgi:hypothetical protein